MLAFSKRYKIIRYKQPTFCLHTICPEPHSTYTLQVSMIWVIHPLNLTDTTKKRLAENGKSYMSGKRGSNPRPPAWKASALSTELFPHDFLEIECKDNEKSHYMQVYREITVIFSPQIVSSFHWPPGLIRFKTCPVTVRPSSIPSIHHQAPPPYNEARSKSVLLSCCASHSGNTRLWSCLSVKLPCSSV